MSADLIKEIKAYLKDLKKAVKRERWFDAKLCSEKIIELAETCREISQMEISTLIKNIDKEPSLKGRKASNLETH